MQSSDQWQFIEEYVRFRFYDGLILVNIGNGLGTQIWFNNREIAGTMTEAQRFIPQVFDTAEGFSSYTPTVQPLQFRFNVLTENKFTFEKLDAINRMIGLGYRCEFRLQKGYYVWDNTAENLKENQIVMQYAVIDYEEATHRQIGRGLGVNWNAPQSWIVKESLKLSIPKKAGGVGGGGIELPD